MLKRHWLAASAVVACAALALWLAAERIVGDRVPVVRPTRGPIVHSIVTTGRVRPLRVRLAPVVSGAVRAIHVQEGERVVAGQVLLELDDEEAAAALANARAVLAQATASRRKLRTLSRAEAEEAVAQARERLDEAVRNYEQNQALFASGAVTRETVAQAETNVALAKSVLRTAELQLRDVERGGATALSSEAALAQARANVALAEARLGYTVLRAPVDGTVISRDVEVGDTLTANTEALALAASGTTELVVELDERNLSLVSLGQSALASPEAFPDERVPAAVSFIAPVVDSRRGTVELRLTVADAPDYFRPDMTVSVDILVAEKQDALLVPLGAVEFTDPDRARVLVVERGRAVPRAVELGIRDSERAEVVAGLDGTELVILRPETTTAGARVRADVVPP